MLIIACSSSAFVLSSSVRGLYMALSPMSKSHSLFVNSCEKEPAFTVITGIASVSGRMTDACASIVKPSSSAVTFIMSGAASCSLSGNAADSPSPTACSTILSVSFCTTTAASGVGWQAVSANKVNIESKIAVNLFIVTSLIAQSPVYYAAVYGVDGEKDLFRFCAAVAIGVMERAVAVKRPHGYKKPVFG